MKYLILFFLIFASLCRMLGQDPSHIIYDIVDGLPSSEVYDVELDNNGYLWFTTDRGIAKYDGYDFQTYTTEDGIMVNTNFDINKDLDGNIWFSGYNKSISCWNGDEFIDTDFNKKLSNGLINNWISNMVQIDSSNYIFFCKNLTSFEKEYKIYGYDASKDTLFTIDTLPQTKYISINNKFNENLIFNNIEKVFYGTGISFENKIYLVQDRIVEYRKTIRKYGNNHNFPKRIQKTNFKSKLFYIKNHEKKDSIIIDSQINGVNYDSVRQKLMLYSSDGLITYSLNNDNEIIKNSKNVIFENGEVSSTMFDNNGGLWITTVNIGIIYVPKPGIKTHTPINNIEVSYHTIHGFQNHLILSDNKGNAYSLSEGNHKFLINSESVIGEIIKSDSYLTFSNNIVLKEKNNVIITDRLKSDDVTGTKVELILPINKPKNIENNQ